LVTPWEIALEALFHDQLYSTQMVARVVADAALMSMMEERGVVGYIRWPVYLGVRFFGGWAWRQNAKALLDAGKETKP
jgi:hypothetical protein